MLIKRGFTLIEVLTTITILAIVATIAAPEYWRMRDRDLYRGEGQQLFDTILDARNAALTNKLCNNGSTAVRWLVEIDVNANPMNYQLRCYTDDTNFVVQQTTVTLDRSTLEVVELNKDQDPPTMLPGDFPEYLQLSFYSGGVNGLIEYEVSSLTYTAEMVQMVIGHTGSDFQHTICFNRVSGFPTFNKVGNSCQSH